VRPSKIGSSLTTEHHEITGHRPGLRGTYGAYGAYGAHFPRTEIRVQGHLVRLVRLVRMFFQKESGPFGPGRVQISLFKQVHLAITGSFSLTLRA
jgi:hypothetical protein